MSRALQANFNLIGDHDIRAPGDDFVEDSRVVIMDFGIGAFYVGFYELRVGATRVDDKPGVRLIYRVQR